ncbi:MAG: CoA transferase [Desulfuromonadales bacterium]|nr:CoA transferase [Desulfuromonadales bacterium]
MLALEGVKVVSLAVNLPGPAAARRLLQQGVRVIKIEPPTGDPMAHYRPQLFSKSAKEWELWAKDYDLPIVAITGDVNI